ncbi:AbrB/MazE/SpoVT family DNA-binding domain-containing protein [Paenibacillus brasilensis]|uniref:Transcriptional pleiotropic regulator of transition state genes n=1 Tax=Paenibacillus brasilensis TaxID=128574 RepID=A0ABU0L6H0_9BACL|nr:AbrB/MazE/SpoVT family DNA-binding domain-containing protein [Paenibacillus brasilensis]MDQ0496860.1 transcriptional pleiotropic regulator of transition state genes [Paenibacillus brasilensis]
MKDIGMTRNIDALGRILIPKEILITCNIQPCDIIEFFVDEENGVVAFEYSTQSCKFCGSREELTYFKSRLICEECRYLIKNGGTSKTRIPPKRIAPSKEITIQLLRFLMMEYPNATQQQYADRLGISQARVSQLIQSFLKRPDVKKNNS